MARTPTTRGHRAVRLVGKPGALSGANPSIPQRRRFSDAGRVEQGQWRELANHMERIRERERARLSRELHDVLGQALTGIKMDLALHRRACPSPSADLDRCANALNGLLHDVQRIASELRPQMLDDCGLVAALDGETREFSRRARIPCWMRIDGVPTALDADVSTALFRICQEVLTNIARHAQATCAWVTLKFGGGRVRLDVRDNGRGVFEIPSEYRKRLGLIGMQERAAAVGGHIVLFSVLGRGTRVRAVVPLRRAGDSERSNGHHHL